MYAISLIGNVVNKVIHVTGAKFKEQEGRGRMRRATPEEITNAGFDLDPIDTELPAVLPPGYNTKYLGLDDGVIVYLDGEELDEDDEPVNIAPEAFRSLAAARGWAHQHYAGLNAAEKAKTVQARLDAIEIPENWRQMRDAQVTAIAQRFDPLIVEDEAARHFIHEKETERRAAVDLPPLDFVTGEPASLLTDEDEEEISLIEAQSRAEGVAPGAPKVRQTRGPVKKRA